MLEMKQTGPDEAALWLDGRPCGGAAWSWASLTWGRERVTVARLSRFEAAPGEDTEALWAYLQYLWEGKAVAAAETPDGSLRWFSPMLERSWRAAGCPGWEG